jgi:hypothetical protein
VNAALLAQGDGKYRCGKCNKVSNALESLFDDWPDAGQPAPALASMPTLGMSIDLDTPHGDGFSDEENSPEEESTRDNEKLVRAAWLSAALILLIVTAFNLAYFFRQPQQEYRGTQNSPGNFGLGEAPPEAPGRDQIQLVGREMRSHPEKADTLRLSATIVNRAARHQAFPGLEVILMDSSGQAIASRRFEPSEYLTTGADIEGGMTPEAYLPVILDLADPGRQAVGFELNIR